MALRAFIQPGNLMRFTPSIAVCIFMKYKHSSSEEKREEKRKKKERKKGRKEGKKEGRNEGR